MKKKKQWNPFKKRYVVLENLMRIFKIREVRFKDGTSFTVF